MLLQPVECEEKKTKGPTRTNNHAPDDAVQLSSISVRNGAAISTESLMSAGAMQTLHIYTTQKKSLHFRSFVQN